jgi:hypothetical protein
MTIKQSNKTRLALLLFHEHSLLLFQVIDGRMWQDGYVHKYKKIIKNNVPIPRTTIHIWHVLQRTIICLTVKRWKNVNQHRVHSDKKYKIKTEPRIKIFGPTTSKAGRSKPTLKLQVWTSKWQFEALEEEKRISSYNFHVRLVSLFVCPSVRLSVCLSVSFCGKRSFAILPARTNQGRINRTSEHVFKCFWWNAVNSSSFASLTRFKMKHRIIVVV